MSLFSHVAAGAGGGSAGGGGGGGGNGGGGSGAGGGSGTPNPKKRIRDDDEIQNQCSQNTFASELTVNGSRKYQISSTHADVIHGNIVVDELCTRIIDTPEFKRLVRLKQLGCCFEVFRCADHTRFVHSLGVMHLANKLVTRLKNNQPELNITNSDVLCVKVAALCHDLGHGPFSHVFDGVLIPLKFKDTEWTHEGQSVKLLTHLLSVNKIDLTHYGLTERDKTFIDEIITGKKEERRKGRDADKFYLYDIVNNIRSGLDVDKLDYFQRDMHHTNVTFQSSESFERFIDSGKVIQAAPIGNISSKSEHCKPDWPYMMCYPDKMVAAALEFFQSRFKMHNTVYTHKVVKALEYMYVDAMLLADNFIKIKGSDGQFYSITECINDVEAYSKLDDTIITLIKNLDSDDTNIVKAKAILERIDKRDLYKCVGKLPYDKDDKIHDISEEQIKNEIIQIKLPNQEDDDDVYNPSLVLDDLSLYGIQSNNLLENIEIFEDDFIVEKWHTHYGKKHENPVDYLRFFTPAQKSKDAIEVGVHIPKKKYGTCLAPETFEMRALRIFVKDRNKIEVVRKKFSIWCRQKNGSPIPFHSSQPPVNQDEDFADRFTNSQSSL